VAAATPVPVLDDGVIRLRRHTDDDIDPIVAMCRDPEFARWTTVPQPYNRDNAKRFIREVIPGGWERGDHRGWAIEARGEDREHRYAGNVDVRGVPVADIGFGLHPWARGRGVMSRAVRLAAAWAFEHGGVAAIHWRANVGNLPSWRLAWACGFTFHGTVPRLLAHRDQVVDAWIGSLLPGQEMTPRTRWLLPPVLRDDRAVLRPFREDDVGRIVEACCDPRTRQWLPGLPTPYTDQDARTWLLTQQIQHSLATSLTWCVADPDNDQLLADVALFDLGGDDPGCGEVGYWTHPDARGRGVMTQAVRLAVSHAFGSQESGGLGLVRLKLGTADGNAASQHVARQAGFTEVGRHRQEMPLRDGSRVDAVWFDALASDPR